MKKEFITVSIVSFVVVLLSLYQTIGYVLNTPNGFVYPLVHNYEQDYYWYLSLMRQGREGNFLVTSRYTAELFPPQLVNTFFPFFGWLARILGISLPGMYTFLRIVGGWGLLMMVYVLIREIWGRREIGGKIVSAFFVVFGAPMWFIQGGVLHQTGEFWTGFDPILRITWLPHHMMANVCMVGVFLLLSASRTSPTLLRSLRILLITILCGFLNPGSLVILLIATGIGLIGPPSLKLWGVKEIGIRREIWDGLKTALPVFLGGVLVVIYLVVVQNSTFPWTAFRDWERFVQYPIDVVGYLKTLGVIGVIGGIGAILAFRKRDFLWHIVVGWYVAPFIGLVFSVVLPVSNGRFLQGSGYIPSGILASLCLWEIRGRLGRLWTYGVVGILLVLQIPSFGASITRQDMYRAKNMTNPLVYVPFSTWEAVQWLSTQHPSSSDSVIFTPDWVSTIIPSQTSYRVLAGHPTFTYETDRKQLDIALWYQGDVSKKRILLDRYHIGVVWSDPTETTVRDMEALGFAKIYTNPSVGIYIKK